MDEDAGDDDKVLHLVLWNDTTGHAVGHGFGHSFLRGAKHLHRLVGSFDGDFGNEHRGRLAKEVGSDDRQQIVMTLRLPGQRIGEGGPHGTGLVADQKIDVGNFIPLAG